MGKIRRVMKGTIARKILIQEFLKKENIFFVVMQDSTKTYEYFFQKNQKNLIDVSLIERDDYTKEKKPETMISLDNSDPISVIISDLQMGKAYDLQRGMEEE